MTEDVVDHITVQGLTLECQGAGVSGINGGETWNDVLRVQMVSTAQAWESVEYNFKIFACNEVICR